MTTGLEIEVNEYLQHFGVAGMKWGVRNPQNRALNAASRAKDRQKRTGEIEKAREHIKSGKSQKEWQKAKEQFKKDKQTIGTREARKKLAKVREKQWTRQEVASQAKDGKEIATTLLLAGAGAVAMSVLMTRKM